jgi:hypothetical protein
VQLSLSGNRFKTYVNYLAQCKRLGDERKVKKAIVQEKSLEKYTLSCESQKDSYKKPFRC